MALRYFPIAEYENRWQKVHAEILKAGLGAAVVWGRSSQTYDRSGDVLYLVNFYSPETPPDTPAWHAWGYYAVLMVPGEVPELICEEGDDRSDHIATDRIFRCRNTIQGVARRLAERGITGDVAVVGAKVLAWSYGKELEQATPDIQWREMDDLLLIPRRIKSPLELDCMREGGRNASIALDFMMKGLVSGQSEQDAVADAVRELYRRGSGGSYISANHGDTIGYWCREPLLGRSADAPKKGDFVRGWLDSQFQGYWFDPGRTAVCGGCPSPDQQKLIDDLIIIIEGVIAEVRPGASIFAITEKAESLIAKVGGNEGGMGDVYAIIGHGIGMHWEPPYIGRNTAFVDEIIAPNMVMGVEYFLTREGVGTVGIEENFIVRPDSNESITYLPMQGW